MPMVPTHYPLPTYLHTCVHTCVHTANSSPLSPLSSRRTVAWTWTWTSWTAGRVCCGIRRRCVYFFVVFCFVDYPLFFVLPPVGLRLRLTARHVEVPWGWCRGSVGASCVGPGRRDLVDVGTGNCDSKERAGEGRGKSSAEDCCFEGRCCGWVPRERVCVGVRGNGKRSRGNKAKDRK
ncbi:hypothetical protein IWX90DRAFT_271580 [Phyllosticta citrichinensis]|uniref:Uncharacterized protein n=1 Tax=Phyllosticta citrichinensis TaxID=1130410 RepID=A0ABR1XMZ9_9PEZI